MWFKKFQPPHRTTLSVRRHAYVQQTFGEIQSIAHKNFKKRLKLRSNFWKKLAADDPNYLLAIEKSMRPTVNIIMALKGRAEIFSAFRHKFKKYFANV